MKKILIAVIIIASFVGCKKGANDPGISFRGRDGRLIGTWNASSYSHDETQVNGATTNTVKVTYDGTKYTTEKSAGNPPVDNGTYEYTIDIQKKGKVTYTEVIKQGNQTTTNKQEGNWMWANSHKNKSVVQFTFNGDVQGKNYITGGMWEVDQLKNKEIILKRETGSETEVTGAAGFKLKNTAVTLLTLTQ